MTAWTGDPPSVPCAYCGEPIRDWHTWVSSGPDDARLSRHESCECLWRGERLAALERDLAAHASLLAVTRLDRPGRCSIQAADEAERDMAHARAIIAGVHGALADAGDVPVPALDQPLYDAVMTVVQQRDRLRALLARCRPLVAANDAIGPPEDTLLRDVDTALAP